VGSVVNWPTLLKKVPAAPEASVLLVVVVKRIW
jgi:hypothetical protein